MRAFWKIAISITMVSQLGGQEAVSVGSIRGIVTDITGAAIAKAEIELDRSPAAVLRANTSVNGIFSVENVPSGKHQLVVTSFGFRRFSREITVGGSRAKSRANHSAN